MAREIGRSSGARIVVRNQGFARVILDQIQRRFVHIAMIFAAAAAIAGQLSPGEGDVDGFALGDDVAVATGEVAASPSLIAVDRGVIEKLAMARCEQVFGSIARSRFACTIVAMTSQASDTVRQITTDQE